MTEEYDNDNELRKLDCENEYQYLWKVGRLVKEGKYRWKDICTKINKELGYDEYEYKGESAFRKKVQAAEAFYDNVFIHMNNDMRVEEIKKATNEYEKAKIKLQTEKNEYRQWLRIEARDEMIIEKLKDSLDHLVPSPSPKRIEVKNNSKQGILCFGDEHYGTEFEILGLNGETLNCYSPEIFEKRMWDLLDETVSIIKKENIDILNVFSLGDFCDGILRVSQLMKLRYGVIDSTIKYTEFIIKWLNELSKHVFVRFYSTEGNHTQLRMLSQPKGTFENENMQKIVDSFTEYCLKDNRNIEFYRNPTGLIYTNVFGYTFLGVHGEVKSMEKAIKDLSYIYDVKINYLIAGHLHHSKTEEVGFDCQVINVPSIIGVDSYSVSLYKTANAGATMLVIEDGKGKTIEYSIKLK